MSYLQLSEVTKSVGTDVHLYPMSLNLEPNAVTILLGATQAGKTSVMRLMAGLDMPSSGDILVDGHSVTGVPVRERNVAMVYQQFINYPSLTVFDNIAFPYREKTNLPEPIIRDLVLMKLHAVGLRGSAHFKPHELSGGMARRVALARAIALDPMLMMYDEPFTGLDPISVGIIGRLIQRLNATFGMTSLIVTHDLKGCRWIDPPNRHSAIGKVRVYVHA